MLISRQSINEIILHSIKVIVPDLPGDLNEDTLIWGPQGALNSIQLVHFIIELEIEIQNRFLISKVILLTDSALSRDKSPFLSVKNLTDFILEFL